MQSGYVVGIDAGGTKIAYGLFDKDCKLIYSEEHPTDIEADGPAFSDGIIETTYSILKKNGLRVDMLDGIGVCMPSYILFDKGHVFMTTSMTNIRDFPMRDYLSQRLPVPVVFDNDANVAALAEHRHGAGRGSKHMVYVATSTGIGGGIIINEQVFRGSYGLAGECGHMIATYGEGIECGCRNSGCFMSYASGRYAPKHVENRLKAGAKSMLSKHSKLECAHILEAYHQGDKLAIETVEMMANNLAICLFNIYQLLNINLFVFGGGLTNIGEALFGKVIDKFNKLNHIDLPVDFRFAELGRSVGMIGAAELIRCDSLALRVANK